MPDILLDVVDRVATITMNRPERKNAFTVEMFDVLGDTLRKAAGEPAVRCIVLTGAGDAFSSGLDLIEAAGQVDRLDRIAFTFDAERSPAIILQQIDIPVIAAINGAAAGYAVGDGDQRRYPGDGPHRSPGPCHEAQSASRRAETPGCCRALSGGSKPPVSTSSVRT